MAISQTIALLLVSFIDKSWRFQAFHVGDPQLLVGILLVFLGLMIITALAITASTRLGQIMTLVICTATFIIGLCADSFMANYKNGQHGPFWQGVYRVIPNIQMFWPADAITQQYKISGGYVLYAACYALLFVTAFLSLAIALFQTREVG